VTTHNKQVQDEPVRHNITNVQKYIEPITS